MAFDEPLATMTVWMEARGEGPEGMLAVAYVIMNRLRSGKFGATVAAVCLHPSQFSCWDTADPNRLALATTLDGDPTLQVAHTAVLNAIDHAVLDPTDGATYYFADNIPTPYWAKALTRTVHIGRQTFYK